MILVSFNLFLSVRSVADLRFNRDNDIALLVDVFAKEPSTEVCREGVYRKTEAVIASHKGQRLFQDATEPGAWADFETVDNQEDVNF